MEIPPRELQSNNSRYSSYFDADRGIAGFVIRSPLSEDSGTYDCRTLANGSYVTSLAAKVTIASSKLSTTYGVVRGFDVQVHCPLENSISSDLPVFWSKDSRELLNGRKYQHSNTRKMTIVIADYRDTGVYHCLVLTPEGTKNAQLQVIVQGPPKPPTQLSLIGRSLHQDCSEVQWTRPQFDGNARIKQYSLTCKDREYSHTLITTCNGDKTNMTVSGLKSGIHYNCNLQAINDIGCSNYSNVVHIFCKVETVSQSSPSADRKRLFSTNSILTFTPLVYLSNTPDPPNATGKTPGTVVTVVTSDDSSHTKLVLALVLSSVGAFGIACGILIFLIRACYKRKYKPREGKVIANTYSEDHTREYSSVQTFTGVDDEMPRQTEV